MAPRLHNAPGRRQVPGQPEPDRAELVRHRRPAGQLLHPIQHRLHGRDQPRATRPITVANAYPPIDCAYRFKPALARSLNAGASRTCGAGDGAELLTSNPR